jgi:hypothetical protein
MCSALGSASAVGAFVWIAPPGVRAAADPLTLIGSQLVQAELREGLPLAPALSSAIQPPKPGQRVQVTYWSQPSYSGPVDELSVRRLIENGKAGALEFRLGEKARTDLRATLGEIDESMRDIGLVLAAQEDMVKEKLRPDAARTILLTAKPVPADPRFPEVQRLKREIRYETGTMWSEPCDAGERHFIVRWTDWPGLKGLYDDRFALIADRQDRARRCIEQMFARDGMRIFE